MAQGMGASQLEALRPVLSCPAEHAARAARAAHAALAARLGETGGAVAAAAAAGGASPHEEEALAALLAGAARRAEGADALAARLEQLGFAAEPARAVAGAYGERYAALRAAVAAGGDGGGGAHLAGPLEWRLDVRSASRAEQACGEARFVAKARLAGGEEYLFEADYATLASLTAELEGALREASGQHARRVHRYVHRQAAAPPP